MLSWSANSSVVAAGFWNSSDCLTSSWNCCTSNFLILQKWYVSSWRGGRLLTENSHVTRSLSYTSWVVLTATYWSRCILRLAKDDFEKTASSQRTPCRWFPAKTADQGRHPGYRWGSWHHRSRWIGQRLCPARCHKITVLDSYRRVQSCGIVSMDGLFCG